MYYIFDAQTKTLTLSETTGNEVKATGTILMWFDGSTIKDKTHVRCAVKSSDLSGTITRALLTAAINGEHTALNCFDGQTPLNVITPNLPQPMCWRWAGHSFVTAQIPPFGQSPYCDYQRANPNGGMLISHQTGQTEITISRVDRSDYRIPNGRPVIAQPNMGINRGDYLIPRNIVGIDRDVVNAALMVWPEINTGGWTLVLPFGTRVTLQDPNQPGGPDDFTLQRLYEALTETNERDTILSENFRVHYSVSPDTWTDLLRDVSFSDLSWLTQQLEQGIQTVSDYERVLELVEPLEDK